MIQEQKQIKERPCKFTLVKFNDNVNRIIQNVKLNNVSTLSPEDYVPDRSTALYDAIGDTIDWFRYEKDVLMVIVTDGQENASQTYRRNEVMQMLDEKQKNRNWSYVYLCNDLQTASQGESLGLNNSKYSANCCVAQDSYGSFISKDVNTAIKNYRTQGISVQSQLHK